MPKYSWQTFVAKGLPEPEMFNHVDILDNYHTDEVHNDGAYTARVS